MEYHAVWGMGIFQLTFNEADKNVGMGGKLSNIENRLANIENLMDDLQGMYDELESRLDDLE